MFSLQPTLQQPCYQQGGDYNYCTNNAPVVQQANNVGISDINDKGCIIKGDTTQTSIKKGRTIIDTVFQFDTPKFTYIDRYAPVHAGNSLQKINDVKKNLKTTINRKLLVAD